MYVCIYTHTHTHTSLSPCQTLAAGRVNIRSIAPTSPLLHFQLKPRSARPLLFNPIRIWASICVPAFTATFPCHIPAQPARLLRPHGPQMSTARLCEPPACPRAGLLATSCTPAGLNPCPSLASAGRVSGTTLSPLPPSVLAFLEEAGRASACVGSAAGADAGTRTGAGEKRPSSSNDWAPGPSANEREGSMDHVASWFCIAKSCSMRKGVRAKASNARVSRPARLPAEIDSERGRDGKSAERE